MSNLTNYMNKTSMVESKLRNIDDQAIEMYNSGDYTFEEIEYFMKTSVVKALNSLGSPSMEPRSALTVPVFQDYRSMVNETVDDLGAVIADALNLSEVNAETSEENKVFKTMTQNKVELLKKNIRALEKTVTSESLGAGFMNFNETFSSTENSSSTGKASINMLSGALTLAVKKESQENDYDVEILEGSTGYPGNTHKAFKSGSDVVFEGEQELHANLNEIIDGNQDTWFEYEVMEIREDVIHRTGNLGFEYKEGLSWLTENRKLDLRIRITLKDESECNTISMKPFLPKVKGSAPCILKTVSVSSEDRTHTQGVANGSLFDSDQFLTFDAQPVKYITIELQQDRPYNCQSGHFFYGLKDADTGMVVRTEGPLPRVSTLGLKYSPKEKIFMQPKGFDENGEQIVPDENRAKDELFNLHLKSDNCFKEILEAKRYMIGLREFSISNQEYHEESVYISRNFQAKDKISSVSLESDEYVPALFGLQGDWIKYYISLDDGKEWLPIQPRHKSHTGPSTYRINSLNTSGQTQGNVKSIYRLQDSQEIKLKIELKRPAFTVSNTPIVYSYNLKVRTGDEILD